MNVYLCRDKYSFYEWFVAAETRGKAKAYYANEEGEAFIDVYARVVKKDVPDIYYGYLDPDELRELELPYDEEDDEYY